MEDIRKWVSHTRMSDPAHHAGTVSALTSDISALNFVVQGLLAHSDWLTAYGLDEAAYRAVSRATLPVAERLDRIVERDGESLKICRPLAKREVGTCRDSALMLCCFLRTRGVPARVRCGFAAYFNSPWEDHWVCEFWDRKARRWRLSDPQLDELQREHLHILFDTTDVPREVFLTAGHAWLACRRGEADPRRFGHGEVTGEWFVKINVVRDHYALNARETSDWDGWRAAPLSKRMIGEHELTLLDDLATRPEQPLVDFDPDWLP